MQSMINWYRALAMKPVNSAVPSSVLVPTFLIRGAKDSFLGHEFDNRQRVLVFRKLKYLQVSSVLKTALMK